MSYFSPLIDGSIIGLYLLVTMAAGIWVRRYVGRVEDFLVAGCEMDVFLGIASLAPDAEARPADDEHRLCLADPRRRAGGRNHGSGGHPNARSTATRHQQIACGSAVDRPVV